MLKTYINTFPYTKFILITDSIDNRDSNFFDHIVKQQLERNQYKVHYCVFEGVYKRTQEKLQSISNIALYDFVSGAQENRDFQQLAERLNEKDVVIIDSLANVVLQLGLASTYRIFNNLKNNKALTQVIAVLHKDLIEADYSKVTEYFENLSTLSINIEPTFMTDRPRVRYEYKKSGGRIIAEIEEYRFEGDHLITNKIAKPDPSKFFERAAAKNVNPEELSTFRIGLTDEEKLSRDKVVLPYLPEANEDRAQEGKIFYQLDEVDDWDEEDPDDDLDI